MKNKKLANATNIALVLGLIIGIFCVIQLRSNYSNMVKLRTKLEVADKNNGDVNNALNDLRSYVYGHMNTNLSSGNSAIKPPIQLKYTYERLASTENDRIKAYNAQVVANGESSCGAQYPGTGYNPERVECVQRYVANNSTTSSTVPDDLYKFDFISPRWSPDLAGFSLIISLVLLGYSSVSLVIKRLTHHSYK